MARSKMIKTSESFPPSILKPNSEENSLDTEDCHLQCSKPVGMETHKECIDNPSTSSAGAMIMSGNVFPVSILKQNFEENSLDTEDGHLQCSHPLSMDTVKECIDNPSTSSSGVARKEDFDFDLINVVKEDLKQNIHKRRQQKGLGEIAYDKDYPRSYQLTAAEKRKRQQRKERNRIAAAKCREKKRLQTEELMEVSERLVKRNRDLQEQAEQLRTEKQFLKQILQEHLAVCPKGRSGCRR